MLFKELVHFIKFTCTELSVALPYYPLTACGVCCDIPSDGHHIRNLPLFFSVMPTFSKIQLLNSFIMFYSFQFHWFFSSFCLLWFYSALLTFMWKLRSSSYFPFGITLGGSFRQEVFGGRMGNVGTADGDPQMEDEEASKDPMEAALSRVMMVWAGATEPQLF